MRARSATLTDAGLFRAREIEAVETPAVRATSRIPTDFGFMSETCYMKRVVVREPFRASNFRANTYERRPLKSESSVDTTRSPSQNHVTDYREDGIARAKPRHLAKETGPMQRSSLGRARIAIGMAAFFLFAQQAAMAQDFNWKKYQGTTLN